MSVCLKCSLLNSALILSIQSNKENTKPECGPKKQVISGIVSKQKVIFRSAPLQSKNDLEDTSGTRGKAKDVRPKTKTSADPTTRNTLSQAFRTQQTVRHRNIVKEVQKPPSNVSAIQKPKPGMYKGRVVQSKIDCFRKPSADEKTTVKKVTSKPDLTIPKPECPKVRSKSVSSLQTSTKHRVNSAVSSRPKSVSDIQLNGSEIPVQVSVSHKRPIVPGTVTQAGACALPRSAPLATGRSAISKPIASKKKEKTVQVETPKTAFTEQKACRPVTRTVSQYTVQIKTAEERRWGVYITIEWSGVSTIIYTFFTLLFSHFTCSTIIDLIAQILFKLDNTITKFNNEMHSADNWVLNPVILHWQNLPILILCSALLQFVLLKALYK